MSTFPGAIFDGEGRPLDNRTSDLSQQELDASVHRSAVQTGKGVLSREGLASIALIWLLNDDASFAAIPPGIVTATIETVLKGQGILILSRRPEVGAEIRDGLLGALELAQAPDEVAGHA